MATVKASVFSGRGRRRSFQPRYSPKVDGALEDDEEERMGSKEGSRLNNRPPSVLDGDDPSIVAEKVSLNARIQAGRVFELHDDEVEGEGEEEEEEDDQEAEEEEKGEEGQKKEADNEAQVETCRVVDGKRTKRAQSSVRKKTVQSECEDEDDADDEDYKPGEESEDDTDHEDEDFATDGEEEGEEEEEQGREKSKRKKKDDDNVVDSETEESTDEEEDDDDEDKEEEEDEENDGVRAKRKRLLAKPLKRPKQSGPAKPKDIGGKKQEKSQPKRQKRRKVEN